MFHVKSSPIRFSVIFFFAIIGLYTLYAVLYGSELIQNSAYLHDTLRIQNSAKGDIRLIYTYRDLEAHLCNDTIDWRKKTINKAVTGSCPIKAIVSVASGGRTGNQLWEYASVWAVARCTGLDSYVPNCIRRNLDKIFENLTVPDFGSIANCPIELNTFVVSLEEWSSDLNQNIILSRYSALTSIISPQVQDLRKEYRFTKELRVQAQEVLRVFLKKLPPKEYTFVNVHVRRTDYIKYLREVYHTDPVKPQFFINAMNHYRSQYHNCLFIYVSDEPDWCLKHFGNLEDVVVTSNHTAALDLAIMGACNHSIFDYGTYGEWGSILAGGTAVTQDFRRSRMMKNWIRISQKPPS